MIDEAKPSSKAKISLILNLFSRIVDRDEFFEVEVLNQLANISFRGKYM